MIIGWNTTLIVYLAFVLGAVHQRAHSFLQNPSALMFRGGFVKQETNGLKMEADVSINDESTKRIPVTLISGFLGVGKTTLLQNILQNRDGLRIGMIVNDVASINIDSKLMRGALVEKDTQLDTVELQNGCVCCSLSDELFISIFELINISSKKGYQYDHIVIEASGVAEPKGVRSAFQDAEAMGMPLLNQIQLDTMVTVIDGGEFLEAYTTADKLSQRPNLLSDKKEDISNGAFDGVWHRPVVDLLVEQVECSDLVVINKADRINKEQESILTDIISALSPDAAVLSCTYGNVPLLKTLGCMNGKGVAELGAIDDHKKALSDLTSSKHLVHDQSCNDPVCDDNTHDHKHSHHHHQDEGCEDKSCTDPSHNHSHNHEHAKETTATTRFGVTSFVFRARRPFHPIRLAKLLEKLPVGSGNAMTLVDAVSHADTNNHDSNTATEYEESPLREAFKRLIRSKGFVWLACSDVAAMYWSHAGRYFELQCLGRWWASVAAKNWPPNQEMAITEDFEEPYGDRRQELVFIGFDVADNQIQADIESGLNDCLLTDQEIEKYEKCRSSLRDLEKAFPTQIPIRYVQ